MEHSLMTLLQIWRFPPNPHVTKPENLGIAVVSIDEIIFDGINCVSFVTECDSKEWSWWEVLKIYGCLRKVIYEYSVS